MHDLAFAEASRPRPQRILRVQLLEYSLGHEILLQLAGNPLLFASDDFEALDQDIQRSAVIRAVQICSRTWAQNKEPDKWLGLWGWFIRRENFEKAVADFRVHRREGITCPPVLPPDDEETGRRHGSPLMARLLDYAGRIFGPAAFDAPMGMVQWMYFAKAEYDGSCRVANSIETQIQDEIAKHEADYRREQEAKCQH